MNKKTVLAISLVIFLSIALVYIIIKGIYFSEIHEVATLYVDPYISTAEVGGSFTVNVNISNVVDLYGWELKLKWNPALLDGVEVTEGPFLKQGGETLFLSNINNTNGYVLLDCTLFGEILGVNGNGTLATIEFHVKSSGDCDLDLYDTILISSLERPIDHTVSDGHFSPVL